MKTLLFTAIAFIFLAACDHKDDVDEQSPLMILEEPQEGDTYKSGDIFHMKMNLSDNENLKECQMSIIPDSISSGHKSMLHGGAWEVAMNFKLSGTSFSIDEHLEVPDTIDQEPLAHGRYLYRVSCIDQAGNLTSEEVMFYLEE